jgi:gliding motility-associated-like protein
MINKKTYIYLLSFFILQLSAFTFAQNIKFFPDTIFVCKNDSVKLSIPKNILSKSVNIQWITPYSIIYHTSSITTFNEGKYILKLKTNQSIIIDSVIIVKSDIPKFSIPDTIMCVGKPLKISLLHPVYKFYFQNDKTPTKQITINEPGTYSIQVSNKGCTITEKFQVKSIYPSDIEHNEYTFCVNELPKKISLKHNGVSKLLWSNGSTQKSIEVDKDGIYWVNIQDKFCGNKTDTFEVKLKPCNCEILVPNTFSPNDDGKNDYFFPILSCEYSYFNFTIYDKWNNVVFSSDNPNAKWDGKYKGNLLPEDVYIYKIETIEKSNNKKSVRTGKVALIR